MVRKKKRVSSTRNANSNFISENKNLLVAGGIVIVAIVALLLLFSGETRVGKAILSREQTFSAGQFGSCSGGEFRYPVITRQIYPDGSPVPVNRVVYRQPNPIEGCCQVSGERCIIGTNSCIMNSERRVQVGKSFEATTSVGKNAFCEGTDLIICDSSDKALGKTIKNDMFACITNPEFDMPGWILCDAETEGTSEYGLTCDGNNWVGEEPEEPEEDRSCEPGQIGGREYPGDGVCDGENYVSCTNDNRNTAIKQFFCDGSQWKSCSVGNSGVKEDKFVCKNFRWMACDDEHEGQFYRNNLCKNNNWLMCGDDVSVNGDMICSGTWRKCRLGALRLVVGDHYCEDQSWKSCENNQAACTGAIAQLCTEEKENQVLGNAFCHQNEWFECGSDPGFLCDKENNEAVACTPEYANQFGKRTSQLRYYCTEEDLNWIECSLNNIGQGVDNNPLPNYGNKYFCKKESYVNQYWSTAHGCEVCAGERAGSCIGSSKVDALRKNVLVHYSENDLSYVGCIDQDSNKCTFNNRQYSYESVIENLDYVCGDNHNWLLCDEEASRTKVASDGGKWLCTKDASQEPEWEICSSNTPEKQQGNYLCSQDPVDNQWKWVSQFECAVDQKYHVRKNALNQDEICNGKEWKSCSEINEDNPLDDPANPNIEFACEDTTITVGEVVCNNDVDDDNDGLEDCQDEDCPGTQAYMVGIGGNVLEVILKKDDCFDATIIDRFGGNLFKKLSVCDDRTRNIGSQVEICYLNGDQNKLIVATSDLGNDAPASQGDIAFLYEQSEGKQVHVIQLRDMAETQRIHLGMAAGNFLAGQRVLLKLGIQYYLLSYPPDQPLFEVNNLQLTHLRRGTVYDAEKMGLSRQYQFSIEGDRVIAVHIDLEENRLVITSSEPGEVLEGLVEEGNLDNNFELTFTRGNPLQVTEPAVGTLSICNDDIAADLQAVQVCHNEVPTRSFRKDTLTLHELNGQEYAFLYADNNGTKEVSVFNILDARNSDPNYNNFLNSLIAGRRTALKFGEKLYLLGHLKDSAFSLQNIHLVSFEGDVTQLFLPAGSEDKVSYLPPEGEIKIQRNYGLPPPPFEVRSLLKAEIAPVDLEKELFTSISSYIDRKISNPNFDFVTADEEELYRLDRDVFKIKIGQQPQLLDYQVPFEKEDALFYYGSVDDSSGELVKTASIYKWYDLNDNQLDFHAYDNEFIETFAGGSEIALKFGDSYYLVGYQNANEQVISFSQRQLTLQSIDKLQEYELTIKEGTAGFDVPEGRIKIEINRGENRIEFSRATGFDLLVREEFEGFVTELTPESQVEVAGIPLRMCYARAYAPYPSARICKVGDIQDPILADPVGLFTSGDDHYVLESNQELGQDKVVVVRKLFNLNPKQPFTTDWFTFSQGITANQKPYLNISGSLYVPYLAVDSTLDNFGLGLYPDQEVIYPLTEQVTPITQDGSFILGETVVEVNQQETLDEERPVMARFTVKPYKYLPGDGTPLLINSSWGDVEFVTDVSGKVYSLGASQVNDHLVWIGLQTEDEVYIWKYFAEGDVKLIYLDGVLTELRVNRISERPSHVTITLTRLG